MESEIQSKIISYLKSINAYVLKIVVANRTGIPDVIACINGAFYAFEVKDEKGKTSSLQEYNLEMIRIAKGKCAVVRSVEDVKKFLSENKAI